MFDFFNTRKIKSLESQIELLENRMKEIEDKFSRLEELADIDAIECRIDEYADRAIERELDNIDFDSKAQDAIDECISNATLSIRF